MTNTTHNDAHRAVDGGFVCGVDGCTEERQTPLGISRHREMCRRRRDADAE